MRHIILVGTHHKTGTVWMSSVFKRISKKLDCVMHNISGSQGYLTMQAKRAVIEQALIAAEPCIIFESHSKFPLDDLPTDRFRGLHVVRDPRDLILSAARYHTWSEEAWLHRRQDRFEGMTYAEKLKSLGTFEEQVIFEMDYSSGGQIRNMYDFDERDIFRTVHYEALMTDQDLLLWHDLMLYLGLEGGEIPPALEAFWLNSLFGGKEKVKHVQDGSTQQYKKQFTGRMEEEFHARFGDSLATLGYMP